MRSEIPGNNETALKLGAEGHCVHRTGLGDRDRGLVKVLFDCSIDERPRY